MNEEISFPVTTFQRPEHVAHLKPGDMFKDQDGDLCIYLGWTPEAMHYHGQIGISINGKYTQGVIQEFRPQHTVLCYYKRTWILLDNWPSKIGTSDHDLSVLLCEDQPKYLK